MTLPAAVVPDDTINSGSRRDACSTSSRGKDGSDSSGKDGSSSKDSSRDIAVGERREDGKRDGKEKEKEKEKEELKTFYEWLDVVHDKVGEQCRKAVLLERIRGKYCWRRRPLALAADFYFYLETSLVAGRAL